MQPSPRENPVGGAGAPSSCVGHPVEGKRHEEIPVIGEPGIVAAVAKEMGSAFSPNRSIPYVQLYEIDSLLFTNPGKMAKLFSAANLKGNFEKWVPELEQLYEKYGKTTVKPIENV